MIRPKAPITANKLSQLNSRNKTKDRFAGEQEKKIEKQ